MKAKILLITLIALQLLALASALTIDNVNTNPSEVEPGQEFALNIELKNNLNDDAEDIEVGLNLAELPIAPKTSSELYENEIRENKKNNFEFELIAKPEAEAGIYTIPVFIKYLVNGKEITKETSVSAVINSKPEFMVNLNGFLMKNENSNLEISITNTGLSKAKFLEIYLEEGSFYKILSLQNVYMGDLDSDDFNSANFEIYVKDTGSISIPITLKYLDATNKVHTDSIIIPGKVYSREEAIKLGLIKKSNLITYIIVIIALICAQVIYRKIKKRKRV